MKNLPCIIVFSGFTSLVLVTVASSLGVSFPYWLVVSDIAGFSTAGGVLARFLTDYAPRPALAYPALVTKPEAKPVAARQRHTVRGKAPSFGGTLIADDMTILGLRNNPATLSLM